MADISNVQNGEMVIVVKCVCGTEHVSFKKAIHALNVLESVSIIKVETKKEVRDGN